jgi:hypothetical protein
VGWDWVHLVRRPLFGLLYQPRMMDDDDVEQSLEWLVGETEVSEGNWPQCHCVHHKSHMTSWVRTRAAAVGRWRLTAWATTAQPHVRLSNRTDWLATAPEPGCHFKQLTVLTGARLQPYWRLISIPLLLVLSSFHLAPIGTATVEQMELYE